MKRKKIMTWTLTWFNVSASVLNATLQFLVIYRFVRKFSTRAWPVIEFDYIVRKSISDSYFYVL